MLGITKEQKEEIKCKVVVTWIYSKIVPFV